MASLWKTINYRTIINDRTSKPTITHDIYTIANVSRFILTNFNLII